MFKSSRWRIEKNKIKVVFKLQFHATQVPHLAKDTLTVSLVPIEIGKPTVRLEKSAILDGTCRWENPIYETVKFTQEPKTGKINERIYQFIMSTGSSKAGVLGEVTLDFANYFDAVKPSSVSLPVKTSNAGAILHITIQRMYGAVDQSRDTEENGIVTVESQDRSLRSKFNGCETDENRNCNSIEDVSVNKTTSQISEANGNLVLFKSSDGLSASGSESSSERTTPREIGMKDNSVHQGSGSFLSSLNHNSMPHKPIGNAVMTNYLEHQRSNTDWSVGSAPDGSVDESTNSSDDNIMKERSPHASDTVEKLKRDLVILARQAEVSELELQTLRKQIVKESKRGQDLSKEVISLKEERDALKQECDQLKVSHRHTDYAKVSSKLRFENDDPHTLLHEIRQELDHEKDLNVNLRIQLQKTQESNSELLLAVQDLDEMLEEKNREISCFSNKTAANENAEKLQDAPSKFKTDDDEEQQALESLVKQHDDVKGTYLLEQKVIDLYSEIEVYRRDRDDLEMQMEQLALDYEILKQENHDLLSKLEQNHLQEQLKAQYECSDSFANLHELETQVESLENELRKQEEDFSTSLITINELKQQVDSLENKLRKKEQDVSTSLETINVLNYQLESLEKEQEKQTQAFEADLDTVMHAKVEQEKRAIRAEEALRKTRLTNANTAERLQEEFRRLSSQMTSTFDANEKLAKKAVMEANELRVQRIHLEEMLEKANEDCSSFKDQYEEKLKVLANQVNFAKEQAEKAFLELEEKSTELEHRKEQEEQLRQSFSKELQLLRDEIEKLTEDKDNLSKQAEEKEKLQLEMGKLKASITEFELLVQRKDAERKKLEKAMITMRIEADKFSEERNGVRSVIDEREKMIGVLQSEVETLKAEYSNLKHSLFESELEKENLRKQVFNLKGDLKKKEDIISRNEKKLKASFDGTKPISRNNEVVPPRGSKEVAGLRERIKLLEGQIRLKEAALENSNNSFLEKEKDLQHKIEELENRMIVLSKTNTSCCEEKSLEGAENVKSDMAENSNGERGDGADFSDQNDTKSTSNNKITLNKLLIATSHDGDQCNLDELLSKMALMRERNESMESELKDMQERYSEISLKFAEVEGERQQLVMTVRNLKNVKKS